MRWPCSGACSRSSEISPWNTTDPVRMIVTLSQMSSTSSMSWELSRTVRPLAARRLISARMSRMPAGSRPLAGSAQARRAGLVEDQEMRLAQEARGDAEALPHAERVLADAIVGPCGEVDDVQDLVEAA